MQNGLPPYEGFESISQHGRITLVHGDCMELLRQTPDKFYSLCIVDPPYGIGSNWKKDRFSKFYTHASTYQNSAVPGADYFSELKRVSAHQIVWGANYYWQHLTPSGNIIVWDKGGDTFKQHISACELAWTSIREHAASVFRFWWTGCVRDGVRYGEHPHEKPTELYRWLLKNYAKPGQRILDTHLGSGSIAIACDIEGFDLVGCEIDADYIAGARKRLAAHQAQPRLFAPDVKQDEQLAFGLTEE